MAVENGAAAVSVLQPMFLKPTKTELYNHFKAIADDVPETPVLLYNNPGRVGYTLSADLVEELVHTVPNIVGMKDTSGDITQTSEFIRRTRDVDGCGMVGTETGAPNPEYKFCPECRTDKALATFIRNLKPVVRCAEQFGVIVAIEPVARHIVYDTKRARTGLDEIGSHNLQILFDPVNLLSMDNVDRRDEIVAEAIELLGKDIAMIHFKDFVRQDSDGQLKAIGAGLGGMDYTQIFRFAKKEKPFIFGTLENTTPENAESCRKFLQQQYDSCE